jgi:hypothetical protein
MNASYLCTRRAFINPCDRNSDAKPFVVVNKAWHTGQYFLKCAAGQQPWSPVENSNYDCVEASILNVVEHIFLKNKKIFNMSCCDVLSRGLALTVG